MFLGKGVLKIGSKLTGQYPCHSVISMKLKNIFIEITLRHGCSTVTLLHIFRTPFPKNTSRWLLLVIRHFVLIQMKDLSLCLYHKKENFRFIIIYSSKLVLYIYRGLIYLSLFTHTL